MAKFVHITCRAHGGVFKIPSRRGRRPVSCGGTNSKGESIPTCTRFEEHHAKDRAEARKHQPQAAATATESRPKLKSTKRDLRVSVMQEAPVETSVNISLPLAMQAKEMLTAKGWNVTGRAYFGDSEAAYAELSATRDDEHLLMVWVDGKLYTQEYHLWKDSQPAENNGRPKRNLGFDPDEMPDNELIRILSGQKVTWYNRLGTNMETGTIGNKVQISHTFLGGRGDENPGERVITFVDHGGGGFRSFHVSALMKVG